MDSYIKTTTLNELCDLITKQTGFDYSKTIKPSLVNKKIDGYLPFIQNKDFEGERINLNTDYYVPSEIAKKYPKILLDSTILLISISGKIGNVGFYNIPQTSFVGGAICVCRLNKDVNGKYIMYFLQSSKGQFLLLHSVKAASHSNITVEDIRKLPIPIPSLSEQSRIVGFLDTFTDSIENLKQQIAQRRKQYEHYRDQLLDLEGKDGVEMIPLGTVCSIFDGTHQTPKYTNSGIKFVSVENINNIYASTKYISELDFEKKYKNKPQKGDVLMTRIGDVGRCAIVDKNTPIAFYVSLSLLRPNDSISNKYIKYVLESRIGQKELRKHTLITAVPLKINLGEISKVKIPFISLDEQSRIVSILDTFEASISNLEAQLAQRQKQYEYYRNQLLTFE